MNSPSDPLSDSPEWVIWGVVWLRYVAVMGLVILLHDTLLTLDDEVRLIFECFFSPYRLFLDSPGLARTPFLAKSNVLHQSLSIYYHYYLFKLPSVLLFFFGWWTRALKDYQKFPAFTHRFPCMWASFIHPFGPNGTNNALVVRSLSCTFSVL